MLYRVKAGESPARIASRFGVPLASLIGANPRKATTVVAGQRTWRSLASGETVSVPVGVGVGFVGAPADAVGALVAAGSPCDQANVALVCAAQAALGQPADGKWGSGTATAAQRVVPGAPAGCSPRPAWWAPAGQSNCVGLPSATAAAAAGGAVGVTAAAAAAAAALSADPNYCASVGRSGTAVNTAIHNFKAAWNAVNPGQAVPINTGKYEPVTAAALSSALGGQSVAPGCGAAPSAPAPAITPSAVAPSAPSAAPAAGAPSAVTALLTYDPCQQQNVAAVSAAQRALGQPVDGKYGTDTAAAAQRLVPGAPAGCSPRPAWWSPPGQSSAPATIPAAAPVAVTCPPGTALDPRTGQCAPIPAPPPAPSGGGGTGPAITGGGGGTPTPSGPLQPVVTAPAKAGISTGAIAAGAVGVVALVGVVAAASMGKGGKGARGARGHSGRAAHKRKTAHKKKR